MFPLPNNITRHPPVVPGHGEAGHRPGLRVVAPLEGGVRGQLFGGEINNIL